MKDTNAIAREQQRRNAELADEMREALRPMPPMTRTDGWTGYTWADLSAYAAQCVRDERERHTDALRCALKALDYCIEDSAELLSERIAQWGQYRQDRQEAMAATLERHRAVAERLRALLMAQRRG